MLQIRSGISAGEMKSEILVTVYLFTENRLTPRYFWYQFIARNQSWLSARSGHIAEVARLNLKVGFPDS